MIRVAGELKSLVVCEHRFLQDVPINTVAVRWVI